MSAELMPLWSGALCVCLAALNANAAVLGADGTHGLAGSQRDRGAVDLCGGGVAGVGAVHGVLEGHTAHSGNAHRVRRDRHFGRREDRAGLAADRHAVALRAQHESVVVGHALHHGAGIALHLGQDVIVLQLDGVNRAALVLDEEVHARGHIARGNGLDAAAVELADDALRKRLRAERVHTEVIGILLEQLVHFGRDVQRAVLQRHQRVGHQRIKVDDKTADGALGGGGVLRLLDVRAHDPLLDAVLVHAGDGHLVELAAQGAGRALLDGLIALVERVDGEAERRGLLAGHFLQRVAHVIHGAEAVGAAAVVLALGYGVNAGDADGLAAGGEPAISVAAVVGGDGCLLESFCDLCRVFHSIIDAHFHSSLSSARRRKGRLFAPSLQERVAPAGVLSGALHTPGGACGVFDVLMRRLCGASGALGLLAGLLRGVFGVCHRERAARGYGVPHLLWDGVWIPCHVGVFSCKFVDIRLSALRCGVGGCIGLLGCLTLGCLLRLSGGDGCLAVLQLDASAGFRLAQTVGFLRLRAQEGNIVRDAHALLLGEDRKNLHRRLALVVFGANAVVIHALLRERDHFGLAHVLGLVHVAQCPRLFRRVRLLLGGLRLRLRARLGGSLSGPAVRCALRTLGLARRFRLLFGRVLALGSLRGLGRVLRGLLVAPSVQKCVLLVCVLLFLYAHVLDVFHCFLLAPAGLPGILFLRCWSAPAFTIFCGSYSHAPYSPCSMPPYTSSTSPISLGRLFRASAMPFSNSSQ
nr:MAG TPA: hypothetical protein [Caudoviricetes sp.]